MTRVLSGIQPSGDLHLGNYLGALKQWVAFQDRAEAYYCIVDLHAVTVPYEPARLRERTVEVAAALLAMGIDPARSALFVQSHMPEHSELAWLLNCVATMGELGRMVQWKEKSSGKGESVSVGLFDYPVLQAADILIYAADEVPVGEDQRQHIELTRDIAQRFNSRYGEVFDLPRAIHPQAAARVMDLQNPENKMSKSVESPRGTVQLLEDSASIAKKFKSAVTDSGTEVRFDRANKPGISNLLELMAAATDREIAKLEAEYGDGGYGTFKLAVADAVVALLEPIQARYRELAADPGEVERMLRDGADKARLVATETLARAKDAMGFLPAG